MADERRHNYIAGLSPANVITLAVLASGLVGTGYVALDDIAEHKQQIKQLREELANQRDWAEEKHSAIWRAMP